MALQKAGATVLSATKAVVVARPSISLEVQDVAVADDGTVASQTVAVFRTADTGMAAGQFAATIDWGDGTRTAGTITGGNGVFQVAGSHAYAGAGDYPIRVDVQQGWADEAEAAKGDGKAKAPPLPFRTDRGTGPIRPPWRNPPFLTIPFAGDPGMPPPKEKRFKPDSMARKVGPSQNNAMLLREMAEGEVAKATFEKLGPSGRSSDGKPKDPKLRAQIERPEQYSRGYQGTV